MFSMASNLCRDLWKTTVTTSEGIVCAVCLIIEGGTDVDKFVSDEMTSLYSLHVATLKGHLTIVQYLVQAGSDVNKTGCSGVTPLMIACSHGFIEIVRFLIQSGANVNAVNKHLDSPIMYLCKGKLEVKEKEEPRRYVCCFGIPTTKRKTCAFRGFCSCLDIAKLLVASGADINLVDDDGMSPLVGFITYRHYTVAKFLIQSGADINLATKWGSTALLVACKSDNLELLEMLISAGADVNDARCIEGTTPLMMAASYSIYDNGHNVKVLLRAGALVNARNSEGYTALKDAVSATNPSMIEMLIKAGATAGREILLAIFYGRDECVQALVTNGALPGTYESILSSWKNEIHYHWSLHSSTDFYPTLLVYLKILGVTSLTPFMLAIMRRDTAVARYFVRNLFLHPLDILLLQDLQKKRSMLEDVGLDSYLSPLVSQPWSLFNLSFFCVSFAVGFCPDREERILLTGLPVCLHRMFLYRDKAAFLPVKDWANLDLTL